MEIMEMEKILASKLKPKRFLHSLGVMECAVKLAERFGVNVEKARIAALLHDCGRAYPNECLVEEAEKRGIPLIEVERHLPILIHAPLGAYIAKEVYGVEDSEILHAIARHTVGGPNMTSLDKVVYLADLIEVHRTFPGVEKFRELAFTVDLDEVMLRALDHSINFIITKEDVIHPDTLIARNEIILKRAEK